MRMSAGEKRSGGREGKRERRRGGGKDGGMEGENLARTRNISIIVHICLNPVF